MRTLTLLMICFAACGTPEEPAQEGCDAPTGEVTVKPAALDEAPAMLDCTGPTLSCEGDTTVRKTACDDGFAVILERGNAKAIVRLKGPENWTAGIQINGVAFKGSLSMLGLYAPSEGAPPAGQKQRGSFALNTNDSIASGTFSLDW